MGTRSFLARQGHDCAYSPPMRALFSALAIASVIAGCAHVPAQPEPSFVQGQLLTADLQPVSDAELLVLARQARYLLVGEQHDDRCDHRVQAEVVRLLGGAGLWAVGLEMVDVDRVGVLEQFSAGELPLTSLDWALDWKVNWGIDFADYEPIFVAAEQTGTPVVPLNLPPKVTRALTDGDPDPVPEELRALVVPEAEVIAAPEEQIDYLRSAYEGHGRSRISDEGWRRFIYVQSLWDSQMAWRAVQIHRELDRQVIVLAGAGHVWNGWGIARRLRAYDREARILSLVAWRGDGPPDPALSDLFFYCPEAAGPEAARDEASSR